ncbi:hypothetical protein LTR85_009589 [Meristemomyces frigidus]|nr:hypothetical protein LTR85_009589 [Meristemomyces frigidus]
MAMSPFALSVLGLDSPSRRRGVEHTEEGTGPNATGGARETRTLRTSRRATSHYNAFQTLCLPSHDDAPAYAIATRHTPSAQRPSSGGDDALPGYTCTVAAEAKMLLQLESINPLHGASESEWREVYAVVRGTLLSFHRVKDGGAGKLLKSYTLQHAEVGLATDTQHTILIPQTRLAHIIPTSTRRKAWQKDPDLYREDKQTILRLRAETDQILLAASEEGDVHDMIHAISAAIDISQAIDERSIPRICTVPRRRRRQPRQTADLNDPALLAEQERIMREMYPAFAERAIIRPVLERTTTTDTAADAPVDLAQTPSAREEDELDLSAMREDQAADSPSRPGMLRQTTASSVTSAFSGDMIYATSPQNFSISGKWQPPHPRTAAQIQRYTRRCIPVLLADSARASDVLICNGRRVKVNWRMQLLEEWELSPPAWKAHGFEKASSTGQEQAGLARSGSTTSSQSPSATNTASPYSSSSVIGTGADRIEPVEPGLAGLELTKVTSAKDQSSPAHAPSSRPQVHAKVQEARHTDAIHGVVFCF